MREEKAGELLRQTVSEIRPPDDGFLSACRRHWDSLIHPLGGFGKLEDMISQIGAIQGTDSPHLDHAVIVIMGADNGVVEEGVSQCGAEVTAQVLENMGDGISSVCTMARFRKAEVLPVNIGMNTDGKHPAIRNCAVRHGTGNIRRGPALTRREAVLAVEEGIRIAGELKESGCDVLIPGEMGIGNTTTSAACICALSGLDAELVTGAGAGLSAEGLRRKTEVVRDAVRVNAPDPDDPLDVLSKVGGLDIAGMCGCFLGAARYHIPVLIDGLICSVAALLACRLCPASHGFMLATHGSSEPGSRIVMEALGLEPVLYAGMHLGEGTGAAAVLNLLDEALYVYYRLPGFEAGKVKAYERLS